MRGHTIISGFAALLAGAVLGAGSAPGAVVIFDDATDAGWTLEWNVTAQATHVYEGTTALASNGQFIFKHTGFVDANNYILEFYANTTDTTPATHLFIELSWIDAADVAHSLITYDNRNVPAIYYVDDVPVAAGTSGMGIALDTDTDTWQKIQLDLSQKVYMGWPYVEHQYVPGVDTITRINFRSDGGQSLNVVLDSVRLVPEPASMGLVGLGLGAMLLRRRR